MSDDTYTCPKCGSETFDADCLVCDGSGMTGPEYEDCKACDGSGTVDGVFECPKCNEIYEI